MILLNTENKGLHCGMKVFSEFFSLLVNENFKYKILISLGNSFHSLVTMLNSVWQGADEVLSFNYNKLQLINKCVFVIKIISLDLFLSEVIHRCK